LFFDLWDIEIRRWSRLFNLRSNIYSRHCTCLEVRQFIQTGKSSATTVVEYDTEVRKGRKTPRKKLREELKFLLYELYSWQGILRLYSTWLHILPLRYKIPSDMIPW
jgi:hypothetical protein